MQQSNNRKTSGESIAVAENALAPLRDLHILFADDDAQTADSMAAILGAYFGRVTVAADGEAVLRHQAGEAADVVLLDIGMPRLNGLETARRLRQTDPDLPLGLLTCLDGRDTIRQAVSLGLIDYLVKPVTTAALHNFLQRCLEQLSLRGRLHHTFAGGAIFHPTRGLVIGPEGSFTLSRNERRLLQLLIAHRGQLVEPATIRHHLKGDGHEEPSAQGLRNLVHRLRGKIGREAIESRKELGYRLP